MIRLYVFINTLIVFTMELPYVRGKYEIKYIIYCIQTALQVGCMSINTFEILFLTSECCKDKLSMNKTKHFFGLKSRLLAL